ncbi:MAG: 3-phosphoshikimate 1-carboxyvinyltransferase [Phycisphaerae bacterium]
MESRKVLPIEPCGPLDADVRLPGSKSLTNRRLFCAALADGESTLREVAICADTDRMLDGLRALGVDASFDATQRTIALAGCRGFLPNDDAAIDCGAAGTAMRFLTALCAQGRGRYRLDGTERMRQRPIGPLVDALRRLGARVRYEQVEGFPPLTVLGDGLRGGALSFETPPSSQFVSALLMAAPYADSDVFLAIEGALASRPYVDMTLQVMRDMGVEVLEGEAQRFVVPAFQRYRAGDYAIEPDASAAAYFWAAAAVTGGRVRVVGLGRDSVQGDMRFVDVLEQMGCAVNVGPAYAEVRGPPRGQLRGVRVDLNAMPDTVQTLAVVALFAAGETHITNVANLRIKETDRLAGLASELARLGARVDVHRDGLGIFPAREITPAIVETYDDHRMAMSFAVAGLAGPGVAIRDPQVVRKSFPGFFDVLREMVGPAR